MAKAERFEDLQVWKNARELVREVYAVSAHPPFYEDIEIRTQIRDAALSAMNNIAEGFERGTNKEFCQFLHFSKGSAGEVRSCLYAALDQRYLSTEDFDRLTELSTLVSKRTSKLITYLQQRSKPPGRSAANS
jgi:four helix bundle protein